MKSQSLGEFGNPLAEALRPIAASLRQRASRVRVISQVTLSIDPSTGQDIFGRTRDACLKWLANRAGRPLPDGAWKGQSFELEDVGAQRVGAVALESPLFWSARLDDADKQVAQRTWVTEIGIGESTKSHVLFGTRLTCVSRGNDAPLERSIPGFVRSVVERGGARLDGRILRKQPPLIDTADQVDELIGLLVDTSRIADVIVISLPEGSRNINDALISADNLHRLTLGAAHVAVLTGPGSYHLSDALGKEFSVFHQGVRTYLSGFDPERDEPFRHPLSIASRIRAFGSESVDGYLRLLVDKSLSNSASAPDRDRRLPPHAELRRISARRHLERAQKDGSSDKELLELALAENQELQAQLDDQKGHADELLKMAESDLQTEKETNKQHAARTYTLRLRIDALETKLRKSGSTETEVPIPTDLSNFQEWCETYLSGAVELHNRAFKGVKNSLYEDSPLLYKTLLLLRNFYVPMRRDPGEQKRLQYERELQGLGLEEGGTITKERAGEQGDTYVINFDGRPRMLDRHLKKGNAKDPRHCFRLYFFWDDDTSQAVVGWLPSHLDTRQS